MRILIWQRADLRLHDRADLLTAQTHGTALLPVYCFDPRQFGKTRFGFPKTGHFRSQFLRESVADLRASLQRLGSDLVIRHGVPEQILPELVQAGQIEALYFQPEITSEERSVETAVIAAVRSINPTIQIRRFFSATLYAPTALPFPIDAVPEVFTQFRKQVEKQSTIAAPLPAPTHLPPFLPEVDRGTLPSLVDLGVEPRPSPLTLKNSTRYADDVPARLQLRGGETAGKARLDHYFWQADRLRSYKDTRNGLLNPDDSSKFSPWLALGCLSPRYIHAEVQRYEADRVQNDSTYWLIFELLWRDYFRFIAAKHGDRLFFPSGLQGLKLSWHVNEPQFAAWRSGQTGYPLIDANMRELWLTGFMSNRGRQNVASFLTKNLGLDWQLGAEWFESQLIDYDVCSNWGNWNYAAGVGNDARGFRYFNILKQSRDYDPQGLYVKYWLPELATLPAQWVHRPWLLDRTAQTQYGVQLGVTYPHPIVDLELSARHNEIRYQQGQLLPRPAPQSIVIPTDKSDQN